MRTKVKSLKVPVPAIDNREPTDDELHVIEESGEADAVALASTQIDLARLGLNQLAYVRRAIVDEQPIWGIYSAAGHPLGAAPTLEQAWGAIMQNDLQPVFVQ